MPTFKAPSTPIASKIMAGQFSGGSSGALVIVFCSRAKSGHGSLSGAGVIQHLTYRGGEALRGAPSYELRKYSSILALAVRSLMASNLA
jgi:hypothetical protein